MDESGEVWLKTRLSSDGLHPNSLGYQQLLEDILNWEAMGFLSEISNHSLNFLG